MLRQSLLIAEAALSETVRFGDVINWDNRGAPTANGFRPEQLGVLNAVHPERPQPPPRLTATCMVGVNCVRLVCVPTVRGEGEIGMVLVWIHPTKTGVMEEVHKQQLTAHRQGSWSCNVTRKFCSQGQKVGGWLCRLDCTLGAALCAGMPGTNCGQLRALIRK